MTVDKEAGDSTHDASSARDVFEGELMPFPILLPVCLGPTTALAARFRNHYINTSDWNQRASFPLDRLVAILFNAISALSKYRTGREL